MAAIFLSIASFMASLAALACVAKLGAVTASYCKSQIKHNEAIYDLVMTVSKLLDKHREVKHGSKSG